MNSGRSIFLTLVVLLLSVGLDASNDTTDAPVLERGEEWEEMAAVAKLPEKARQVIGNQLWMSIYLELFTMLERRVPKDYAELSSSVYMPGPDALINPYEGRPAQPSDVERPGDFIWKKSEYTDSRGVKTEDILVLFPYDPDGSGKTLSYVSSYFSEDWSRDFDESVYYKGLKAKADALSPTEQKLFYLCRNLEIYLHFAAKNILGVVPAAFERFLAIDWLFSDRRLPNLWTGGMMKAVSSRNPSPGDFTYSRMFFLPGDPTLPFIVCYGDNGKIIFPWDWDIRMESEALRKSITGDTRDLWPLP